MVEEQESENYQEQLKQELSGHELKLTRLLTELAELQFKINEVRSNKYLRQGKAGDFLVAEGFRKRLQAEIQRKEKHCNLVREELSKVKDRLLALEEQRKEE